MATAGSGDVLTGITAAVAAMGVRNSKTIYHSACMSVLIHAVAGDEAAELIGRSAMRAGDIACSISKLLP
jgi:NAD(P)H-hydrate epimerase